MSTSTTLRQSVYDRFFESSYGEYAKIGITAGPGLVWLLLLLLFPLVFLVTISFASVNDSYQIVYEFSVSNYVSLLEGQDGWFRTPFIDTFLLSMGIAVVTTLMTIVFAFPVAYLLARASGTLFKALLFTILLPFFTIYIVRIYSWYAFFGSSGIINSFLVWTGLVSGPVSLFNYGVFPIVVALAHAYFPYMLLTLYSSLDGIDYSVVEAARDLGSSRVEVAKDIVVPLSAQGLITGSIFVFVPSLGSFITPKFLAQGKVAMVGEILADRINQIYAIDFGSAGSIFLIIPCLIGFLVIFKYADLGGMRGI
ncbi:ABC transporter permease [Candidatus Halobonum tyrrellensis]|uniref:ABC transporter permease n=1 Tax=Candidatus Halobonum tyrrellensis TaxID=1431545 RepID=UPI00067789BA|nr:ABC transporter permease [Candidatus Halobonum tyrrellensis]